MDFNTQTKTASAFNPALKYVESIAGLLDILDGCFLRSDYLNAYKILMRVYGRVEHKLRDDESEIIQTSLDDALKEFNNRTYTKVKRYENFHKKLIELEKQLKRYMDKYGLMMPSKEDPRFAVLKR